MMEMIPVSSSMDAFRVAFLRISPGSPSDEIGGETSTSTEEFPSVRHEECAEQYVTHGQRLHC